MPELVWLAVRVPDRLPVELELGDIETEGDDVCEEVADSLADIVDVMVPVWLREPDKLGVAEPDCVIEAVLLSLGVPLDVSV